MVDTMLRLSIRNKKHQKVFSVNSNSKLTKWITIKKHISNRFRQQETKRTNNQKVAAVVSTTLFTI